MIYIDSSVALAYLLAESRVPAAAFWNMGLVSSRLLEYEVWNRIPARQLERSLRSKARALLTGVQLIELSERVLARALEPWPTALRTLDALHLATVEHLRSQGGSVELASYDTRLAAAAQALGIPLAAL
ncbi:MAG: PIN domain-containing protein [Stellaceae bacterium]